MFYHCATATDLMDVLQKSSDTSKLFCSDFNFGFGSVKSHSFGQMHKVREREVEKKREGDNRRESESTGK